MFKMRSNEKKRIGEVAETGNRLFHRNLSSTKNSPNSSSSAQPRTTVSVLPPRPDKHTSTSTKHATTGGWDTDPNTTDSDGSHATPRRTGSTRKSRSHTQSMTTPRVSSNTEKDSESERIGKRHRTKSSSGSRRSRRASRRSKRRSKQSSTPDPPLSAASPDLVPSEPSPQETISADPNARQAINPFANKGEVYLCHDMALVADAMKLDLNTRIMLAYYDAKTLEDFSLLAESDLKDLVTRAQAMRRTIPPLQIRKIQVLREWVQEISTPQDESRLPAWIRLAQKKKKSNKKTKKLIPEDWKAQFTRDLPKLKHQLRQQGGTSFPTFSLSYFAPSFQSISMCGLVQ